jgi:aspartyl-tRNA(Asn)/glutamyl-tRNA(Gln) amidotransferase subunit B
MKDNLPYSEWEPVIGLEIHAALNTKSKLFSTAANHFGDEPNTNISVVCTGQPGALPVLNKEAVRKAVQFGCAVKGKIARHSRFDRKSYFYPDSPRNFQITQFEEPIIRGGEVIAEVDGEEKTFAIHHVHLEDDAGMLKHFSSFSGVDYNRAGVPLIEIVSMPCLHSAKDAVAYAMAIKAILEYIDASDCNMEEGLLRFDANVSVRLKGEKTLRNKIEIKNMNSFSNMELAVEAEIKRQIAAYISHKGTDFAGVIQQATYRFDPETKKPVIMRTKENEEDYRYFPEPDLLPLVLSDTFVSEIEQALPELPLQRQRRYMQKLELSAHSAFILTSEKKLADYFEEALSHGGAARALCNWITVEFAGRFKDSGKNLISSGITPKDISELIMLIEAGKTTGRQAKEVADKMVENPGKSPKEIVQENPDLQPMEDDGALERIIDEVLALPANGQSIAEYKEGREKALAFLVGQVMKQTRGKAVPQLVNELLKQKIGK